MKFGVPLLWVPPEQLVDVVQAAEELGYESVWAPDHLVLPAAPAQGTGGHGDVPPDMPLFDVSGLLSYVAAVTTTLRVGTWVYVLSARDPFTAARAFQTVDVLSGGRVEMGIGAGYVPAEFAAAGVDFSSRGRRTEEAIEICRSLWRDEETAFHGESFDFEPMSMYPKPVQPGGPRIHIGGTSRAALRRAARLADGWMGLEGAPEELAPILDELRDQMDLLGRTSPLEITSGAGRVIGRADLPPADAQMVERYEALGVDRLIVRPWRRSADAIARLEAFAEECIAPRR